MADRNTTLTLSNAHLGAGNNRPSERRAEQVAVFQDGVALDSAPAELLDKFALQVLDDEFGRTDLEGFLLGGFPVLVLADIGLEERKKENVRTRSIDGYDTRLSHTKKQTTS